MKKPKTNHLFLSIKKVLIVLSLFIVPLISSTSLNARIYTAQEFQQIVKKVASLDKDNLINLLKKDFLVSVQDKNSQTITPAFLCELYLYFRAMEITGPLNIYTTDATGPSLVQIKKNNWGEKSLYFSKNAGSKTWAQSFSQMINALQANPTTLDANELKLTMEYNNELYRQLNILLASTETLKSFLQKKYNLQTYPVSGTYDFKFQRNFTHRETALLLNQLIDLPPQIVQSWHLEKIVRMQGGFKLPKNAAANYSHDKKIIRMADPAFLPSADDDSFGEGTFLHEVGHAVWHALSPAIRDDFLAISWEKNAAGDYAIRMGMDNFVSDYAWTKPGEDFAETFAHFIDNSENIKHKAAEKYSWIRHNIFFDTEYFTDAADNVKTSLISKNPDTEAPYMENITADSIKINITYPPAIGESEKAQFDLELIGAFDDISGIQSIELEFAAEENNCAPTLSFSAEDLINPLEGRFKTTITKGLEKLRHCIFSLAAVDLQDKAGNKKTVSFSSVSKDYTILGKRKPFLTSTIDVPINEEKILSDTKIFVEPLPTDTFVKFELPMQHTKKLKKIMVILEGQKSLKTFHYIVRPRDSNFLSKIGEQKVIFTIQIPGVLKSEIFKVTNITLFYGQPSNKFFYFLDKELSVDIPRDNAHFNITHESNVSDNTPPHILVNKITMQPHYAANSLGGNASIHILIPTTGLDRGKESIHLYIRSPIGKELHFGADAEEIQKEDGIKYISYFVPLAPNHAAGEYIISAITLLENYETPKEIKEKYSYPYTGFYQEENIRLLQRGIRHTLNIKNPRDLLKLPNNQE